MSAGKTIDATQVQVGTKETFIQLMVHKCIDMHNYRSF